MNPENNNDSCSNKGTKWGKVGHDGLYANSLYIFI